MAGIEGLVRKEGVLGGRVVEIFLGWQSLRKTHQITEALPLYLCVSLNLDSTFVAQKIL